MKLKNSIITPCLALALAGSAHAAVFTALDWVNDTSLSFITSTNVTHSGDFNSAASINGFTFEQVNITGAPFGTFSSPYVGSNFEINSSETAANTFTFTTGSAGVPGTASGLLSTSLIGFGGVVGNAGSIFYTLDGLAMNTDYEFYFFNPVWTDTGRTGFLEGSVDPGNTFAISQANNAGNKIIRYSYNTGATTSFTMEAHSNASLHYYSFVNTTAIPEPSTWALLALSLGALVLSQCRRSPVSKE